MASYHCLIAMLSPEQRTQLKARAHHLDPVVMIGDAGLSETVLREIDAALKSHELIKIRVLGDDRDIRAALAAEISSRLEAALVQRIGKLIIFYRPRPAEAEKTVRRRKPSGPRQTKKLQGARVQAIRRR